MWFCQSEPFHCAVSARLWSISCALFTDETRIAHILNINFDSIFDRYGIKSVQFLPYTEVIAVFLGTSRSRQILHHRLANETSALGRRKCGLFCPIALRASVVVSVTVVLVSRGTLWPDSRKPLLEPDLMILRLACRHR